MSCIEYARKKETPSALISGAIRGALRSGRYAKRSIATPRSAQPAIAASVIRISSSQVGTFGSVEPPSSCSAPKPMNEPTMNTSPWAKLRSFRIP